MALELADYISELVPTNPVETDQVADADDHMRLIKKVVQQSFPNVSAAVTATADDLNVVVGTGGVAGAGVAAFEPGDQIILMEGVVPPGFTLIDTLDDRVVMVTSVLADCGFTGGTWDHGAGLTTLGASGTTVGVAIGTEPVPADDHFHYVDSNELWRPEYVRGVFVQKD